MSVHGYVWGYLEVCLWVCGWMLGLTMAPFAFSLPPERRATHCQFAHMHSARTGPNCQAC